MHSPLNPVAGLHKTLKRGTQIGSKMVKKSYDRVATDPSSKAWGSDTASTTSSVLLDNSSNTTAKQQDESLNDEEEEEEEEGEEIEEEEEEDSKHHVKHNTKKVDLSKYPDITRNNLEDIATTSAILGVTFGFGLTALFFCNFPTPALYLMALSGFHFLEFWVTAKYNPTRVHTDSFIINNGSAYAVAHSFALIEVTVEYFLFPNFKMSYFPIKCIGFILIIVGQLTRTIAMRTAGRSFNHLVQVKRADDHQLITSGIYSYLRHPSYFGFFWWAIGTQLLLTNPLSLAAFAIVLYKFFDERIAYEEKFLIGFFGDKYVKFRDSTPVLIPFIN